MTAEEAIKHLKLIVDNEAYADYFQDVCRTAIEALEKVEEYKRLEEQGLLVRLPCKVGDMVYIVGDRYPAVIYQIHITEDNDIIFDYVEYDEGYELKELWDEGDFDIDDIGKSVFLTREEAEAKLKELEE